ncbi:hypothetical protein EX30DRAFT_350250 [Ascodesmis nigricans]|uniref:Uncharacterized protein n=1 Tax=Ascodesmis nigricans TaxID=341454 RepID=A0A4S2MSD0_9PEZI|nr:hypothetical protein EX30DRAFT_350250 [Ascodesmis nigricans]
MPRAYDNPQNLRSPTDPIEDDGPGLRHESMQAGSTRGSGNLKLTGGGNGAAVGSTKKKSKIPGGSVGPYNNLSNVRGTAGVIPIPKRKSEGGSTEDTRTPKKPRSMRLESLQSHSREVHQHSLLSDPPENDDDEVSEISPHFASISTKSDNADSKARTLQKLDQRAQELDTLSALNGLSAFVDNISISPQRLGGKRLAPARPEAPKTRPTRGLHSRNQKYEVKPKPTTIPLVIFQRGKHVVQDEGTVLVLEKPTNIDDIIVTPTNNHGSYSIASFGLHDMGSHFNVCRETRTFCITLRSQYADFPPKQRVMFTTRDESGVDQFINIVQQRRGVTPNNLSEKSVKAWTGETQRLVENHGARPTPPPTDEEQEVQEQVLLEQQQQKDEELVRQMHRDENRRVTRASTMRGHKTEFSSPLKTKTNGANSGTFAAALPRTRQSMRLKEPSSPK